MPILPLACWTTRSSVPIVNPPVEKVDVAVVEVAVNDETVSKLSMYALPATESIVDGVLEPIPMFPLFATVSASNAPE